MIRNARVYAAELPDAATLEGHLEQLPYDPIRAGEIRRHAFVTNPVTEKLVTRFPNGYSFTLRTDERVIPPSIVTRMLDEHVREREDDECRVLRRVEKLEMREALIFELAKTALVRTKLTFAYYDEKRGYLIVDSATKKNAEPVLQRLLQVMEALKTTTIHVSEVSRGLSAKLLDAVAAGPEAVGDGLVSLPFGRFIVGDSVKMKRRGDEPETVTYAGVDVISNGEIEEQLRRGFRVSELRLVLDGFGFKLADDFGLKSFSWPDVEYGEDDEDAVYRWETDGAIEIEQIGTVVDALVDLLEYKAPEDTFDLDAAL